MRLTLDEDLGRIPLELLRDAGHDVLSVPDQRLEGTAEVVDATKPPVVSVRP